MTWSPKNIAPERLSTPSNAPSSNRWIWPVRRMRRDSLGGRLTPHLVDHSSTRRHRARWSVSSRPPATLPLGGSISPKGRMMSSPPAMTTTSYAILGLLAVKPWTTHELVQQIDRTMRRIWPRAQSKLYEEPKKLVAHGYARASDDSIGRRRRTRYTITAGPPRDGGLAAGAGRWTRPRVRTAAQDQLRGQRHEGRHPHQFRHGSCLGRRAERGEPRHRAPTSTATACFPRGLR